MDPSMNPSFFQFFAWKLGKAIDRKATKTVRTRTILQVTVRLMLNVVGFSCLTFAGFTWSITAGLVVAGFSCFTLAWLATSNPPDSAPDSNRPQR